MLNRLLGILFALAMLLANVAVFTRDVLPRWRPGNPPPSDAQLLRPGETRLAQVGIYNNAGHLIGRSWTRSQCKPASELVSVATTTVLHPISLPGGLLTPRVRVETQCLYRQDEGHVDEIEFRMFGVGMTVSLRGEAMSTGEFSCSWQVGERRGSLLLDAGAPQALGDVIRPFDRLPDLRVGQTWQLRLLNPLARMLPQLNQTGIDLEPVIIRVVERRTIDHAGQNVDVFVVDGGHAVAYVAQDGRVLRQEVDLPLVGRLVLLDEPFDEQSWEQARRAVPVDW